MIKPVSSGDAFLRNVTSSMKTSQRLHLWWLGHSGFLLQWNGEHLLFDPLLSEQLTTVDGRGPTRLTEAVVEAGSLDYIDVVAVGSERPDHFDASTLSTILSVSTQATLLVPEASRSRLPEALAGSESSIVGMEDDSSVRIGSIAVIGVAGEEQSEEEAGEESTPMSRLGYIAQLGPWTIYHAGGTPLYDGLEDRLSRHAIDIAILPVSDSLELCRDSAPAMSGAEAARLAHRLDVRLVIPSHYEMFPDDFGGLSEFVETCQQLGQPYRLLRCGERWSDNEIEDLPVAEEYDDFYDRMGPRGRQRYQEGDE